MTSPGPGADGRQRIAAAVSATIRQVLHETGREPVGIDPRMSLAGDLGLDSLDLAQTVVLLERALGVDPFRDAPPAGGRPSIRLVDDLITLYTGACASGPPS
jgi:acyl carrier protein